MKALFLVLAAAALTVFCGCSTGKGCPGCGAAETVRVVYGLPGTELAAQAERGEVALGGCCISGDDPDVACAECGTFYRSDKVEKKH